MKMMLSIILSNSNLILQASLALSLSLLLSFVNISSLFLQGLHTYIHPDDVSPNNTTSQNGVRAAIRRPGASDSDLKNRKRSKEKFEFDENKAQIFRLKLNDNHLQSRLYFNEFRSVFNSTIVASSCMLLHKFLSGSKDSGILANGSLVPILLGFAGVCRAFILIVRVSFERSASKRSEKQLSVLLGVLGFLLGLTIVFGIVPPFVIDIEFESLDGFGRFWVAVFMGCIAGFLFMPAAKSARAFWLGTDQIRCNLSIICCGWIGTMLLYANYLLTVFTSLLWINPLAKLLVNKSIEDTKGSHLIGRTGDADELVGNVGMLQSDFDKLRLWCLLASGLLQIVTLRLNLQIYLNEAVLCWYQRLHASKVPDLDFSRAKVFLHNHYLCLAVLQFFVPPALVLLFLGFSQIDDYLFDNFQVVCTLLPCSAFVKEVALFVAWWVVFVWSIFTSASLVLYRRGILYVS
uniref:Transmembrane protein 161B n=1 Tax=Davidia involucrata TaxID=16924 RepID=A0A5B7BUP5_DAVIN